MDRGCRVGCSVNFTGRFLYLFKHKEQACRGYRLYPKEILVTREDSSCRCSIQGTTICSVRAGALNGYAPQSGRGRNPTSLVDRLKPHQHQWLRQVVLRRRHGLKHSVPCLWAREEIRGVSLKRRGLFHTFSVELSQGTRDRYGYISSAPACWFTLNDYFFTFGHLSTVIHLPA